MFLMQENARNVVIKDTMRDHCVASLVDSWYQIMVRDMLYLTLGRACAARVTVVGSFCVCVCLFNISPLERFFCPENHITYSTGNDFQIICGDFPESALLQRSSTSRIV